MRTRKSPGLGGDGALNTHLSLGGKPRPGSDAGQPHSPVNLAGADAAELSSLLVELHQLQRRIAKYERADSFRRRS